MSLHLDVELVQRVKEQVERVAGRTLATGVNPVRKVPLIISGNDGTLIISEFVDYNGGDEEGGSNSEENNVDRDDGNRGAVLSRRSISGGMMSNDQSVSDSLTIMTSALNSMRRQNDDMKNQLLVLKETNAAMMMQMNASIRRLSMLPVSRVITYNTNTNSQIIRDENEANVVDAADNATRGRRGAIAYESTLCKCPKSLFVLWQEYEFGVGGRKPAKNFNAQERGRVKFNYCLRKHFWDLMNSMIRHGYTFNVAIDKIYSVYDRRNSATKILRAIRNDAKNGGNPQLQF